MIQQIRNWFQTRAKRRHEEFHNHGCQWHRIDEDTAFAPPFGTIRQCRVCNCLVTGGPTVCVRCAELDV